MMDGNRQDQIRNIGLIAIFVVMITIWFWWPLTGIGDAQKSELRPLATGPGEFGYSRFQNLAVFSSRFEDFFIDHFPVRYHIIRLDRNLRYSVFREHYIGDVMIGEDGWLFWNRNKNSRTCQQTLIYSDEQLNNWIKALKRLERKLDERNIELYFHIVPIKCSMYPEFTDANYLKIGDSSYVDQFVDFMALQDTSIKVIDSRPSLLAGKGDYQVYHRTDTHWTDYGAYIGYRDVIQTIFPEIGEEGFIPLDALRPAVAENSGGNLTSFLTVERGFMEDMVYLGLETDITVAVEGNILIYSNPSAQNDLVLLVFHDSFYASGEKDVIQTLLAEHFYQTIFLNHNYDDNWNPRSDELMDTLNWWQPDIVLVERTEHVLSRFSTGDPD